MTLSNIIPNLLQVVFFTSGLFLPTPAPQSIYYPAAEVPLPNRQAVYDLVQSELPKPIPEDYQIPSYISSGLPLAQGYDTLARRYPLFYGFQGEQSLASSTKYPQTYQRMSLESKSIRRYYDRNSRY